MSAAECNTYDCLGSSAQVAGRAALLEEAKELIRIEHPSRGPAPAIASRRNCEPGALAPGSRIFLAQPERLVYGASVAMTRSSAPGFDVILVPKASQGDESCFEKIFQSTTCGKAGRGGPIEPFAIVSRGGGSRTKG